MKYGNPDSRFSENLNPMSRIGKRPVAIPAGADVTIDKNRLTVTGPKGTLQMVIHHAVTVTVEDRAVTVVKRNATKIAQAMWGTTARLIANMIEGVTNGFTKKLELQGVGFRMAVKGKNVEMALGFSHPVIVAIPEDITVTIEGMVLTVAGIDRQKVGQFAANVRAFKPVEPYKGKGFRYEGEKVRRKEGKKSSS